MLAGPEARAQQWVQSFAQITTGKDFVSVTMATGGPNQAGNPDLKTFKVPVDGHIKGCRHNITNGSGNYWFCGTTAEAVELIKSYLAASCAWTILQKIAPLPLPYFWART